MVDFSKISQKVNDFVKETMKMEGNSKRIDTQKECDRIGEYLSQNRNKMGNVEIQYLEGLQVEYTTKAKQKDLEDSMTAGTKEAVDKIKKRMENKKQIDTDEEAQALLLMLRNTKGEYNKADLAYIKQVLIDAGYGDLLEQGGKEPIEKKAKPTPTPVKPEPKPEPEPIPAPVKPEPKPEPEPTPAPVKPEPKPEPEPTPAPVKPEPKPEPEPTPAPVKPEPKPEPEPTPAPVKPEPKPEPEPTPQKPDSQKYQISERGRTDGIAKANRVYDEIHTEGFADNDVVKNVLKEINSENAYSFFKTYHSRSGGSQLNKEAFSLWDPKNKITAKSVSKAMNALLKQAEQMGLENTAEFKALDNEIQRFEWLSEELSTCDPTKASQVSADKAINNLIRRMGVTLEKNS